MVLLCGTKAVPAATAESVERDIWDAIAEHVGSLADPVFPAAPVWSDHVSHAQLMRDFLDRESRKSVCGVCSRMCRAVDVDTHDPKPGIIGRGSATNCGASAGRSDGL